MEHYELIRRKVIIEGKSQRDVAKELHHFRKTVAKALELRIPPGYRLTKPRPSPVIEPVRHIIDAWLEQNKHTRPKQRQTGMRIYERLRDEYGFKRHYGTAAYQASSQSSKRGIHATLVNTCDQIFPYLVASKISRFKNDDFRVMFSLEINYITIQ